MKKFITLLSLIVAIGITSGYGQEKELNYMDWSYVFESGFVGWGDVISFEKAVIYVNIVNGLISLDVVADGKHRATIDNIEDIPENDFFGAKELNVRLMLKDDEDGRQSSTLYVYDGDELKKMGEQYSSDWRNISSWGGDFVISANNGNTWLYSFFTGTWDGAAMIFTEERHTFDLNTVKYFFIGEEAPEDLENPFWESSVPTGINEVKDDVKVYYANGALNVESSSTIGGVSVCNLTGSVVKTLVSNENTLSENVNLPKGVYVVKFGTTSAKIVVQ